MIQHLGSRSRLASERWAFGQAHVIPLALAEWVCRTLDRLDPTRMHGSFDCVQRSIFDEFLQNMRREGRTHVLLRRAYSRPIERFGDIVAHPSMAACTIGTALHQRCFVMHCHI